MMLSTVQPRKSTSAQSRSTTGQDASDYSGALQRTGIEVDSPVLPPYGPGAPHARSDRAWYPWGPRQDRSEAEPSPAKTRGPSESRP
jgi:hypothetical protein